MKRMLRHVSFLMGDMNYRLAPNLPTGRVDNYMNSDFSPGYSSVHLAQLIVADMTRKKLFPRDTLLGSPLVTAPSNGYGFTFCS